ncbi:MAG: beta-propeller fold lactonase family protein [Treponema sp.]|nr:beta-propeller fold lactonase family protein [Treponema sp.]
MTTTSVRDRRAGLSALALVSAIIAAAAALGGCSNPLAAAAQAARIAAATGLPSAPSDIAVSVASHQVTLSWTAVQNATSYNIYCSTSTSSIPLNSSTLLAKVSSGDTYTHTGLTNKSTYYYAVTSVGSKGESAASATVSAVPLFLVAYVNIGGTGGSGCGVQPYGLNPQTGALTAISGSTFTGSYPSDIVVTPNGKFAYITNYNTGCIYPYTVTSTGALSSPLSQVPCACSPSSSSTAIDPTGSFLYVLGAMSTNVTGYLISSSNGALSGITTATDGIQSFHIAISPLDDRHVLVASYMTTEGDGEVYDYTYDSGTGQLTACTQPNNPGYKYVQIPNPCSIAISPAGNYCYVGTANSGLYTLSANTATGELTKIQNIPDTSMHYVNAIAIDPQGEYLFGASPNKIVSASIQSDGTLIQLSSNTAGWSSNIASLRVDPTGQFLVVADENGGTVRVLKIDRSSGTLREVTGSPFATGLNNPCAVYIASLP